MKRLICGTSRCRRYLGSFIRGVLIVWLACLPLGMVGCAQTSETGKPVDELLQKSEDEILAEVAKLPDAQIDLGLVTLIIAKGYYPDIDIKKYLEQLDNMADEIEQLIGDERGPGKMVQIINDYLYETKGIGTSSQPSKEDFKDKKMFLNKVLDTGVGNCMGLSILYLALAERLGLPIYGVRVPGHLFVRYDDGSFVRNIETTNNGQETSDERYLNDYVKRYYGYGGETLKEVLGYYEYLKNLSKKSVLEGILVARAISNHLKGFKQKAKDDWDKAIKLSVNLAVTYGHIASRYQAEKNYDEAISWTNKTVELSPDFYLVYYSRGHVYLEKGDLDKALQDSNKAIAMNPDRFLPYHLRGAVYYEVKEYDKALKDFDRAIELSPDSFMSYHARAAVLYKRKEYNRSLESIEEAIELEPTCPVHYYVRGLVYKEMKKPAEAIKDFKEYLELYPGTSHAEKVKGYIKELQDKLYSRANSKIRRERLRKLVERLDEGGLSKLNETAHELVQLDAKEVVPDLIELLHHDKEWVCGTACWVLVSLGATEAIPELVNALVENKIDQFEFLGALEQLGVGEAIPELVKKLKFKHNDIETCNVLIYVLGELKAKKAVPELTRLLGDDNETVRSAVLKALEKCGVEIPEDKGK